MIPPRLPKTKTQRRKQNKNKQQQKTNKDKANPTTVRHSQVYLNAEHISQTPTGLHEHRTHKSDTNRVT